MEQSNTRQGLLPIVGSGDLSAANGRLVKAVNNSGSLAVALPTADDDAVQYLVVDGKASGETSDVLPLAPGDQRRSPLVGTCVPADTLVLAATSGADKGGVRKLPVAAGDYTAVGIAEETGVDGQLVRYRVTEQKIITVA